MITLNVNKWYVYTHSVGSEIIYVGMGKASRPFDVCSATRSKKWRSIVKGDISIRVVREFEIRKEAFEFERWLTRLLDPVANVYDMKMLRKADERKEQQS